MWVNIGTKSRQAPLSFLRYMECSLPLNVRLFTASTTLPNKNYTSEEQEKVLNVINNLKSDGRNSLLNKTLTEKITNYIQSHGRVENLEQLLKVPGLGPKSLRKTCDEILGKSSSQDELHVRKKTLSTLIVPDLSHELISNLRVIGAVQVGVNTLSWVVVDLGKKEVLEWKVIPLMMWDKKTGVMGLYAKTKELFENILEADIYVFEDINWSSVVGSQALPSLNLHRAEITAILITLLNQAREGDVPRTVFLKSRLTARVFNKVIGSEKVSYQKTVENIMQQNLTGHHSNVYVGPWLKTEYLQRPPADREAMCEALLTAICFLDIIVYRRSEVLDAIKVRRKSTDKSRS